MDIQCVGIDPASSKGLMIWMGSSAMKQSARAASSWISDLRTVYPNLLICWDSPLSFDSATSLSDRPVEKVLRRQVEQWVREGRIEKESSGKKAVSVKPFSGCSHWVISCEVVGQPFARSGCSSIPIASSSENVEQGGAWLIEAHPAVAMAIWWIIEGREGPFPVYKQRPGVCMRIAETLGFTELCERDRIDDDVLDAYVAHRLAEQFLTGESCWVGDARNGGFILPRSSDEKWSLNEKIRQIL